MQEGRGPVVDLGYGYYPTEVGSWVEYQVDSLWRDDRFNILDSVSYRLRQLIESEYVDLEGALPGGCIVWCRIPPATGWSATYGPPR